MSDLSCIVLYADLLICELDAISHGRAKRAGTENIRNCVLTIHQTNGKQWTLLHLPCLLYPGQTMATLNQARAPVQEMSYLAEPNSICYVESSQAWKTRLLDSDEKSLKVRKAGRQIRTTILRCMAVAIMRRVSLLLARA